MFWDEISEVMQRQFHRDWLLDHLEHYCSLPRRFIIGVTCEDHDG